MINIYEILKDCPVGTKLYCTMFGEVLFTGYIDSNILLNGCVCIDKFGKWNRDGECVLFPSKEQRDWSKFVAPQPFPEAGELCWTMTSVGNWVPRYATGLKDDNGNPIFFDRQNKNKRHTISLNNWRKWCDFEELIKQLK